jgi:hypothetical protein
MLRPESLPSGWAAAFDAASGRWEYAHTVNGVTKDTHPVLDYYTGGSGGQGPCQGQGRIARSS